MLLMERKAEVTLSTNLTAAALSKISGSAARVLKRAVLEQDSET